MNNYQKQPGDDTYVSQEAPRNQTHGLSGQQMQALAKSHADSLAAIKRDVELRKWAVDQACGLAGAENCIVKNNDSVGLARAIHAFLIEGAVEKPE